MANTTNQPIVRGREHVLEKYVYKTWWIFSWYERVSAEHIANDIVIETDKPIRQIIVNGEVVKVFP